MTLKELLIDQFDSTYDTNAWFVTIRNAVEGITAEQADWKPAGAEASSIRGFLTHVYYYNFAYLQRFKLGDYEYTKKDNDETFETEKSWEQEIADFDAMMQEWRSELKNAADSKFDELVPNRTDGATWTDILGCMMTHNAYHAGEIVLLRKLQGSWNKEQGVS